MKIYFRLRVNNRGGSRLLWASRPSRQIVSDALTICGIAQNLVDRVVLLWNAGRGLYFLPRVFSTRLVLLVIQQGCPTLFFLQHWQSQSSRELLYLTSALIVLELGYTNCYIHTIPHTYSAI